MFPVRATDHSVFHNFPSTAAADGLVEQWRVCTRALEARVGGADQREMCGL